MMYYRKEKPTMRKLPIGQRVMIDNGGAIRVGTITRYDPKRGAYVIEPDGRRLGDAYLVVRLPDARRILTPIS